MSDLARNLAEIRANIARAEAAAGRPAGSVRLVAVSKTVPAELLRLALAEGQTLFGESRAQELRDKAEVLGPGPRWHFLGTLQKNKVRLVVGRVEMVQSVDSLDLARALDERVRATGGAGGPLPLPVLVQVHLGDEATKHGFSPEEALAACAQVAALPGLALRGLMTLPPWCEDPADAAVYFRQLAALAAEGRARGLPLAELSMGMSHDYEVAIACGATLVRVGTALFGDRPRPLSARPFAQETR